MKMEQTECSETSAYKIQTPGNYPEENIHSYSSYLPAYEDVTECSETSAYKIQTPGNYPEENVPSYSSYLPAYEDVTDRVFQNVSI
jgi:hypothetical protein